MKQQRYKVDERVGIIAVIDTKHSAFEPERQGCHADFPWTVASWHAEGSERKWYGWERQKADALCATLNTGDAAQFLAQQTAAMLKDADAKCDKLREAASNVDLLYAEWCSIALPDAANTPQFERINRAVRETRNALKETQTL